MFNLTKFCHLAGHYGDLSYEYRMVLMSIFVALGISIVFGNSLALVLLLRNESFRVKRNMFLGSLIVTDLLFGGTFVPIFVWELLENQASNCSLSSWRVLSFTCFFLTRLFSISVISLQTFLRTTKPLSSAHSKLNDHTHAINVLFVWALPFATIIVVGMTPIRANKILGLLTLCYFVLMVVMVTVSYGLVLYAIKRAKSRFHSRTYNDALTFVRKILVSFLLTSIPLVACGLVLVMFAYSEKMREAYAILEHQVYGACLAIASFPAVINPVVYFRTLEELQNVLNCCCKTEREELLLVSMEMAEEG